MKTKTGQKQIIRHVWGEKGKKNKAETQCLTDNMTEVVFRNIAESLKYHV